MRGQVGEGPLGVDEAQVVSTFLAAARAGDLSALLTVLAPDVVRRADPSALPPGAAAEVHGAGAVAEGTVRLARRARIAELALVNGSVGVVVAPRGRLLIALTFVIDDGRIAEYDVMADPARLRRLDPRRPRLTVQAGWHAFRVGEGMLTR